MDHDLDNAYYFYRNAVFTRKNNQVALVDIEKLDNESALDEWLGIIVSLADGCHTIDQLIKYMTQHYNKAPDNLEKTIHSVLNRLIEGKIVRLSEKPIELPYYLASPVEELDMEKARKLLIKNKNQFAQY
jgi:hypothetical protein